MLPLKEIVQQLDEKDLERIASAFRKSRGDKYNQLLVLLRTGRKSDQELSSALEINAVSLSTLKSRLHTKLQEFLNEKHDVISPTAREEAAIGTNIIEMIFTLPRETSIAALKRLEKDYADRNELFSQVLVLSALKKASKNTNAYFNYSQQFNKAMAVAIANEKCDDLLMQFATALGTYWHSRDDRELELLLMIKKEITNYTGLYASGHFTFINEFINLSLLAFIPWSAKIAEACSAGGNVTGRIEDLLSAYPDGAEKKSHRVGLDYLLMLYAYEKGDMRHSYAVLERLRQSSHVLFLMGNYSLFPGRFLDTLLIHQVANGGKPAASLAEDCLAEPFRPFPNDEANYISWMRFRAMVKYHNGEYDDSIVALNRLQNDVNLKKYLHVDLELRCFQAVLYILVQNHDRAMNIIFNLGRKLRDIPDGDYENLKTALRIMTMAVKETLQAGDEMSGLLMNNYEYQNTGRFRIMETISLKRLMPNDKKSKSKQNEKA